MKAQGLIIGLAVALVAAIAALGAVLVTSGFGSADAAGGAEATYVETAGEQAAQTADAEVVAATTGDVADRADDSETTGTAAVGTTNGAGNESDGAGNDADAGNAGNNADADADADADGAGDPDGAGHTNETGDAAECPDDTLLVGDECVPVIVDCISGYVWNGDECVPYCPEGTTWTGSDCVGISILCAPGYELVGDDCIEIVCPDGTVLNGHECELVCVLTHHVVDGECVPFCFFGEDASTGECLPPDVPQFCLVGNEWVPGHGCLEVCPTGFVRFGPTCIKLGILDDLVLDEFDFGLIDPSIFEDLLDVGPIVDPAVLEDVLTLVPDFELVLGNAFPGRELVLGQALTLAG